jgi:hypothetical protein
MARCHHREARLIVHVAPSNYFRERANAVRAAPVAAFDAPTNKPCQALIDMEQSAC